MTLCLLHAGGGGGSQGVTLPRDKIVCFIIFDCVVTLSSMVQSDCGSTYQTLSSTWTCPVHRCARIRMVTCKIPSHQSCWTGWRISSKPEETSGTQSSKTFTSRGSLSSSGDWCHPVRPVWHRSMRSVPICSYQLECEQRWKRRPVHSLRTHWVHARLCELLQAGESDGHWADLHSGFADFHCARPHQGSSVETRSFRSYKKKSNFYDSCPT